VSANGAPPAPATARASRARLLSLLSEACELEHALACSYLYAAFSLERDLDDGLGWVEQQRNRRWASQIYHVAAQEMLHLAQAWNLLAAVGGMPYYARPNFPLAARHYPLNVALVLRRFDLATLERFLYYETPAHNDPYHPGPVPPLPPAASWPVDESFPYTSVGQLYGEILQVVDQLDEAELFLRSDRAQAGRQLVDFADLVPVVDRASATAAVQRITLQGEGVTDDREDSHYGVFRAIRSELAALGTDGSAPTHLAHPVADNPYVRRRRDQIPAAVLPRHRDGIETTEITDQLAVLALDLFDDAYVAMLQALAYAFVNVEDGGSLVRPLARASLELMTTVLKPLGEAIARLPSGQPGVNAGATFALSRHCYLPAPAPVSRAVYGERLAELAAHARLLATGARNRSVPAPARDQIDSTADNLARLASHFTAHPTRAPASGDLSRR
jgi:hypothetical protein